VLALRRAEQARFGMPLWKLLGLGLVGVVAAARWWAERGRRAGGRVPCAPCGSVDALGLVTSEEQADVLLADVRRVLDRHGLSCGRMPLRVRVANLFVEGVAVRLCHLWTPYSPTTLRSLYLSYWTMTAILTPRLRSQPLDRFFNYFTTIATSRLLSC